MSMKLRQNSKVTMVSRTTSLGAFGGAFRGAFIVKSRLMTIFSVLLLSGSVLALFQNCGSYDLSSTNPLYDVNITSTCLGVNCQRDINNVKLVAGYSAYTIERATAVNSSLCDSTQCLDFGGYCEIGGYVSSVFYTQWELAGVAAGAETRTSYACDSNGRFHIQVHVPTGYDWTMINHLRIVMKVIDENKVEYETPTGNGEFTYQVSTRSGS